MSAPRPADDLYRVLEEARTLGFLGPGPVEDHVRHAEAFVEALRGVRHDGVSVDLGSGGGLPGLVVARALPDSRWLLLDAQTRRTAFLQHAVERLELTERVQVRTARAEVVGREDEFRHRAPAVVARSFASPPVTAECASPLLEAGGILVVSEPPGAAPERWPKNGLDQLGMEVERQVAGPPRLVVIRQVQVSGERFPRRTGVPAKRPLW